MTKIDIFSGFLGAGKTTLIKKLIAEAYTGEKIVLIENEFGEIAIDGGFLKDSGVQINEMNSGCICCSLVGDFADALQKVLTQFHPDRILIEPSGVGKLSDVIRAVQGVQSDELVLNGFTTVVDANKCRMYMKNFGEFFNNQVENASAIILSRTEGIRPEKLDAAVALLREKNPTATIVTTPWTELDGKQILETMERRDTLSAELEHLKAEAAEEDDEDEHEHHHHHHDDDEHECCCGHHHHHDGDDDDDHEHEHHHDHDEHDHEHDHDHEHEHEAGGTHPGEIVFKKALAEAVGLQTVTVNPAPFTDVIKTSGRVMAAQGEESVIVATVPGVISFGSLPFVDGTAVRKGQAVLSIASNALSDGDVAAKAKFAYETAKKEYERMQALVGDKIVSAKDFEQARLNYENAKVAYEAIAGKQTAKGVSVVSPLNGYLKNIQVKEGDYVSVGQPLATISQNNRLVLRADVSERYYNDLPMIQTANFMTPYDNALYKLSDLRGRLLSYGKASDMNSFYVPVTFEFDNKGAVIPGSFVEIFLLTKPMENVLSVPVSALIEEQGVYSVFIRLDEEGYKKQWVTLGANNGSEVQILSGLKPGDEVVTRGAYQIKLSSASNAIPAHSHSH